MLKQSEENEIQSKKFHIYVTRARAWDASVDVVGVVVAELNLHRQKRKNKQRSKAK